MRFRPLLAAIGVATVALPTLTSSADGPALRLPAAKSTSPPSRTPAAVTDDEAVTVDIDATGRPTKTEVRQELTFDGDGRYVITQRGRSLSGTTSGHRVLTTQLALNPTSEASHLPLGVSITFTPKGGKAVPLHDGKVPGAGTITVALTNRTGTRVSLPRGVGEPAQIATALDALQLAALAPGMRPPTAGDGLASSVRARSSSSSRSMLVKAPLRVIGRLEIDGQPTILSALLTDAKSFSISVSRASRAGLSLQVAPSLDIQLLRPPRGILAWGQWAMRKPTDAETKAATATLATAAGESAAIASVVPYLGAQLDGSQRTTFTYRLAGAPNADLIPAERRLQTGRLIAVIGAVLLVLLGLDQVRRRI